VAEPKKNRARRPISDRALVQYMRTFGRTPKILDLPQIYIEVVDTLEGGPVPEGLLQRFRQAVRQMEMETDAEPSVVVLDEKPTIIEPLLRSFESLGKMSNSGWKRFTEAYSEMLRTLVADRDLFWAPRAITSEGIRWIQLRNASPKQTVKEQIRRDDPTLFFRLTESKEQRGAMDKSLSKKILATGQVPARQRIRGRFMLVGVDAALIPNEITLRDGTRLTQQQILENLKDLAVVAALPEEAVSVYSDDGKTKSREEFTAEVDKENAAHKGLTKVNSLVRKKGRGSDKYAYIDPADLRKISTEDFNSHFGSNPKAEDYTSLTDDPYKSTALTKIYPVGDYLGKEVILAGRFKGFYVADLVNHAGRLIEGSVTYYNPDTGELDRRETTNPDGSLSVRRVTEPYVTVDSGRLLLTLSREKGDKRATLLRNAVLNLSKLVPSIEYEQKRVDKSTRAYDAYSANEEGDGRTPLPYKRWRGSEAATGRSVYSFDPKDFGSIRDAIGSMALSNAASRMLQAYFAKIQKAERATEDRSIKKYNAEKLKLKRPLRRQQAQAVAWLDANDNAGICALDTGVGKTSVAVATMQNLRAKYKGDDGTMTEGNGRFLFVCKKALSGNLPKEIKEAVEDGSGVELNAMTDIITYLEFKNNTIGTVKNPYDPPRPFYDDYVAIFFDEAHERFKNKASRYYKAVTSCKAKRKVLLTASPMVRSPKEVFTLSSVANGIDLNTKEGRKEERAFVKRYAEKVGGRVVGIKRADTSRGTYRLYVRKEALEGREPVSYEEWPGEMDVAATRDFNTWVKTNLFHADKRDVVDNSKKAYKVYAKKEKKQDREPVPYKDWPGSKLEELNKVPPVAVTMPPEIEAVYRKTMTQVIKALREVVKKTSTKYKGQKDFKDKDFRALAVEAAKVTLRKPLALLTKLSDVPNRVLPGVPNPKLEQAKSILEQVSGRTLLFTDSPDMAEDAFAQMLAAFPGKGSAVAFSDRIEVKSGAGDSVRYGERRYPDLKRPQPKGKGYIMEVKGGKLSIRKNDTGRNGKIGYARAPKNSWKVIVLQYIQANPSITTLVLTGTYAVGQNLQKFNNVIHLDRDNWSNETMKQRSARAWRAGQSEVVNEYTLDMVYGDVATDDDADKTLDEIREIIQGMDADLFDEVVLDSQVERLGEEWSEIKKQRSLLHKTDRLMMERALSPHAPQLGTQDSEE